MSIRRMGLRGLRTLTALAAGALALTACAVGPPGVVAEARTPTSPSSGWPTRRSPAAT